MDLPKFTNHAELLAALERDSEPELMHQLGSCAELRALEGLSLSNTATGEVIEYDTTRVAQWLRQRAQAGQSVFALDCLSRNVLAKSIPVDRVALVYGITADQRYDLHSDFILEPGSSRVTFAHHADFAVHNISVPFFPVDTVLVHSTHQRIEFVRAPRKVLRDDWYWEDRKRHIDLALGLISLATGTGVFAGALWEDSPGFLYNSGTTTSKQNILRPTQHLPFTSDHCTIVRDLFESFPKLGRRNAPVRASLNRYRSAISQWDPQQAVVDIAVALEGLLIHDGRSAISQRFSLRGAWLLAQTPDQRLEAYHMLRRLYSARSDLVHTGGIKWGMQGKTWSKAQVQNASELLSYATDAYQRLAKRLILGGYPDWTKIVLDVP
jgi:hypothetical protein